MTNDIADIIKSKIEGLPFVDRLAGLVKVLTISEETDTGKKRKSFPVACNVSASECNNVSKLKDLTPDSSKRSVMYFEESGGTVMTGTDRNYLLFRSSVRLVCWLNLQKMGLTDCGWSSTAVLSIMKELSSMTQPANYNSKYIQLQIKQINEAEKSPLLFSKYTYDEATNQYLIYPYDYFAINITVEFRINANCIDPLEIPDLPLCDDQVTPNPNTPTVGACWDLLRWDCDKKMWVRFNIGNDGQVLKVVGNEIKWEDESSGGITSETDPIFTAWESTNGANLINHLSDTSNPHHVTKAHVGLSNVDNTSDADKPVSSATQTALNAKQDTIGYTPENSANKTDTMAGNTASSAKYLSAKGIYDWVISLGYITASALSGYATQAWVNSQGYITNVVTALGYTPENTANKSTSTGDSASSVKFPVWSAVVSYVTGLGYQAALTAANFGAFIAGLTSNLNPIDTDEMVIQTSGTAKKLSWLSLKSNISSYIGFKDVHVTDVIVTGTTAETIVHSLSIPAGTGAVGKVILAFPRFRKLLSNGTLTVKGYINTSNAIGGANFYAPAVYSAITRKITANKFGLIKSATETEFFGNVAEDLTVISATSLVVSYNIDWTVQQYIIWTVQLTSASDSAIFSGHLIEIK